MIQGIFPSGEHDKVSEAKHSLDTVMDPALVQDARIHMGRRQNLQQLQHGSSPALRSDLARALILENREQLNLPTRLLAAWLARQGQPPIDFASIRAAHLVQYIEPAIRRILRNIPVGTLPSTEFVATIETAPKGGCYVLVSLGFIATMTNVTEWCSAALPYWGKPQVSQKEAGSAIAYLLKAGLRDSSKERASRIKNWFKDIMLGGLPNSAVNFAIAHEYAHIMNGLTEGELSSEEIEHEADRLGSILAIGAAGHPLNFQGSRKIGAAGVEIVLQTIRVRETLGICQVDSGHPSACLRLERFHENLRQAYGQSLIDYIRPFVDIFDAACGDPIMRS